nr:xylulose kinase-1 [Tanacetum cinerariifolium]
MIKVLPPKTVEEVVAREGERKARTTLLMALPEDHLAKFHKMVDAKEMWEAIKSRFGGNDESKKMQKYLLKQQFEGFSVSASEGLHKGAPQLDCDDLEQINDDDLEEMDLKWQVAMISMRIKKFHTRTGRKLQFDTKDPVDNRMRDAGYNGNKARDNGKRPAYQDDSKALVTMDGEDINWYGPVEEDTSNFAMMAYSSSNSGFDNESVFMNKECDLEDTPVNDRYVEGMHIVPPPMTGNYMPSKPDVEINYSKFTYGPKQTSTDESNSKHVEYASSESDSSVEITTSMYAPVDNAQKNVCEPKVWKDAPIIEECESDSDDDLVSNVQENIKKT